MVNETGGHHAGQRIDKSARLAQTVLSEPALSLTQVVYTSVLANLHGLDAVTTIVRSARAKTPKLNVTGLLLFDGTHFCQYLEGPAANVAWLLEHIRSDARHVHFTVRHQAENVAQRLFPNWNIAYSDNIGADISALFEPVHNKPSSLETLRRLVNSLSLQTA